MPVYCYYFLLLLVHSSISYAEMGIKKPNFIVFMTDDQDVVLNGMAPMKNVLRFIANEGMNFTNSFVTSPICCPSRASFLTGQYVHNHRTNNNSLSGGCYGNAWRQNEGRTFANFLQRDGYNTFYAGKYLNEYGSKKAGGPERVPPGWTEWHGLVGNSVYYDYTISNNGVPTYSSDLYLTDIIRDLSISYIENQTTTQPFLMVMAPPAPHQPFTPARRHLGKFNNVTAMRNPSFNIAAKDKHWLMQMPPSPLPDVMYPELDRVFRSRWESLLAVDEMVADVIESLNTMGFLEDTYIIYTSDNGYHVGQFSQVYDKRQPYETDIRVPFLIRGPGIEKNVNNKQPILNIDLAPTILHLAGINVPDSMDGKPINLIEKNIEERVMLIEYYGEGHTSTVDPSCPWKYDTHLSECYPEYVCKCQDSTNNTFGCVRHIGNWIDFKFCLFNDNEDFVEIYDLKRDPHELTNAVNNVLAAIKFWYRSLLTKLLSCKGAKNCSIFNM